MKTYDLTELALRNLRESSLRNSLTTIGISVGVASLVAMLSSVSACKNWRPADWRVPAFLTQSS